jgi:crotonobetainyl-CoA:carnitine CoA-transferase CaiB-like acyl-CoA transferase
VLSAELPLRGILVADFSRVLAGPLCTQLLGDAGARVIKVEEPLRGDETRRWGPPFAGEFSAYFLSINRNKESLALDLKRGGDVARRLIERADVVVDNFLPAQRQAVGMDDIRAINPRAIHCTITGYDSDTSDANAPGYDLLAQAGAGLMSITGEPGGEPMKTGVALSDVLTAHHAFGAILTALFARERTGEGASIEISLFAATLASLVNVAQNALVTGREAKRYGNAHPSIVPYQLFEASDRAFVVGAGTDRHFRALCERVIERPALANDQRFTSNELRVRNRAKLIPILAKIFTTRTAKEWVSRCRAASIPVSLVQGVREALRSESGRVMTANGVLRHPARFDGKRRDTGSPAPRLGEHTDRILRELGYDARAIAALRREGIIPARTTAAKARR